MREADNLREVAALGVDYIGLIFWPKSPRYVDSTHYAPLDIPASTCQPSPSYVGVFVNPTAQDVITSVVNYHLDVVQLHGHETPTLIRNLRRTLPHVKFWKAISVDCPDSVSSYIPYADCVDAFVFDTKCKTVGGSGEHFDWNVLQAYDGERPYLLSGGIGADDAPRLRDFFQKNSGTIAKKCIGIDLNSRFEMAPALKDVDLIRHFLSEINYKS